MDDRTQLWNDFAAQLAVDSIRCTTAAASGHPTSSMSAAHLTAVLYADHLRTHVSDPADPANDRFVLSKGHAAPVLYSALKAIGAISDDELLSLRRFGSPIQGHPAPLPELPWVDVATGSLGQGLPVGVGMALALRLDGSPGHVWVMVGDSEMAEGSVWEAMETASFHGLSDLTAILDLNRLGQRGPTMHGWTADVFRDRAVAFGWHAIEIDGHDVAQIDAAYSEARATDRPTLIVARTEKGHGVSFTANAEGWHGKALSEEQAVAAIAELGGRTKPHRHTAQAGSLPPDRPRHAACGRSPGLRRPRRHPQGVRRRPALAGRSSSRRGGARRRGRELHVHGRVPRGRPRAILRGLHRGTDDGRSAGGHAGARQDGLLRHVRCLLHARRRLRAHGGDRTRGPPTLRLARGRVDRRGRPFADGAGRPGDDARLAQLDGPVSGGRERDGEARDRHVRPPGHLVHPHDARSDGHALRPGRGSSRSEAARRSHRDRTTG